jgi:hypothetical protein
MDQHAESPMSSGRVRLVLVILGVIVVGQLVDILLQREDWPFSNYPMYAKLIRKKETSLYRLYGRVIDGKGERIIPIVDDNLHMYVPPLNELRMKNILEHAWVVGGEKATRRVLRDYMAMYEERRILGRQPMPEQGPRMLDAICMKMTWKLDAAGGTVGEPKLEQLASASAYPPIQEATSESEPTTRPAKIAEAAP